ncbi:MAG: DciA family protein [Telluria sp.]
MRSNQRLAALLPAAMRMASLQQDVARVLPALAQACSVVSFEGGVLTLGAPNAAVVTRLKQQAGSLAAKLQQRGWGVEQVKLKVLVTQPPPPQYEPRKLAIPETGVKAFEELGQALDRTAANAPLIAALERLAARRR